MNKKWYRDPNEICTLLEHLMAIIILIGIVIASFSLWNSFQVFWVNRSDSNSFLEFIDSVFRVVIGIEFFKLLWKPTKITMIEVLMFVIARHMIIGHSSVQENLLSVIAIGILFCIDKFLLHDKHGQAEE